jgi:stage V sporulation protein G
MAMEITDIKIIVADYDENRVMAYVSFVIGQCLLIRDMKLTRARDGYFLSMPARKTRDGDFQDTVAPINREARKMIEDLVLKEFERITGELAPRRISKQ